MPDRMPDRRTTTLAVAGLTGPVVFTTAWVVLGILTPGYDQGRGSISAVAAVGRPHATAMLAAFAWQGLAQLCLGAAAGRSGHRAVGVLLGLTGLGTLGVAALPLPGADGPGWLTVAHSVAATLTFTCLHLAALAGGLDRRLARPLRALGAATLLLALPGTIWFTLHLRTGGEAYGYAEKAMTTVLLVFTAALAASLVRPRAARPVPGAPGAVHPRPVP